MPLLFPAVLFPPITFEGEVPLTPVPAGATGAWITLQGRGGEGDTGDSVSNENQTARGGGGGGGGGRVGRSYVPVSAMGSTFRLTLGSTSSRFVQFISGPVQIWAGWGADAVNATRGLGGSANYAVDNGYDGSGLYLAPGGAGGSATGGQSAGNPSPAVTNGAGSGGGGGGGARGGSRGFSGGAGGSTTGGPDPLGLGKKGANGAGGTASGNGGRGGRGGGGGGYTPGGTTAFSGANTSSPGIAYAKVEWV